MKLKVLGGSLEVEMEDDIEFARNVLKKLTRKEAEETKESIKTAGEVNGDKFIPKLGVKPKLPI